MSTDLELLELAAKAAGIDAPYEKEWGGMLVPVSIQAPDDGFEFWDPLTDDGDRLRLARDLGISIDFADCCAWKRMPNGDLLQEFWGGECGDEAHAVLRVAAEIGKHSAPSEEKQS
jgi:hypothetical protein